MNFSQILSRTFCSGPFNFALGFGLGILGAYMLSRMQEHKKLEEAQKEIEALIKIGK